MSDIIVIYLCLILFIYYIDIFENCCTVGSAKRSRLEETLVGACEREHEYGFSEVGEGTGEGELKPCFLSGSLPAA